jgi:hypothetical protein
VAIDFDALDLVRGENRSRTYSKKLDELTQRNHSLLALAEAMIREIPDDKKWSFEERLKKIKNSSWQLSHQVLCKVYCTLTSPKWMLDQRIYDGLKDGWWISDVQRNKKKGEQHMSKYYELQVYSLTFQKVDENGESVDGKIYEYTGDHSSFTEGIDEDDLKEVANEAE